MITNTYTPVFNNPYKEEWNKIDGVKFLTPLTIIRFPESLKGYSISEISYVLYKDYSISIMVDGKEHIITVPNGMVTDLVSVPDIFRSIIGKVGPHLEAAIVHDWLYIAWQDLFKEPMRIHQKFADDVMNAIMIASNVKKIHRLLIYNAVRAAGWPVFSMTDYPRYVKIDQ